MSAGWLLKILSACLLRLQRALRQLLAGTQGIGPPLPGKQQAQNQAVWVGLPQPGQNPPGAIYSFTK